MTAEAVSAAAQPGPARSPVGLHSPERRQRGGPTNENVGQIVWLQLLDHLSSVPHPAALPGWLATTTRRECLRVLRAAAGPAGLDRSCDAG